MTDELIARVALDRGFRDALARNGCTYLIQTLEARKDVLRAALAALEAGDELGTLVINDKVELAETLKVDVEQYEFGCRQAREEMREQATEAARGLNEEHDIEPKGYWRGRHEAAEAVAALSVEPGE